MKRLWISVIVLIAIFSASLWNTSYINRVTGRITELLNQASVLAEAGNWPGARALTQEALDDWNSQETYLYITLIHSDNNEISVAFQEVLSFIDRRSDGEYFASNARLIARLEQIHEMDELALRNIL